MNVWNYIERHHESFGSALFVIPVCLVSLGLFELIDLVVWLLN